MIELGKKYRTQDGRDVRIYSVDGGGQHPVHGAIKHEGIWHVYAWRLNGEYTTSDSADLIEVQPEEWWPVFVWGNAVRKESPEIAAGPYPTREAAMAHTCVGGPVIDAWLDPRSGK